MARNKWYFIICISVIVAGPYCCSDDENDQSSNNGQAGAAPLQCPEGSVEHTTSSGEIICCPGDNSKFCDENTEGYTGGCWPENTECDTITECDGQWASCPSGALPFCINDRLQCLECSEESSVNNSASGRPFCCDAAHPAFCDENDQGFQGGCWEAGVDCQTIAQCNGEWSACGSGMVVLCDTATGQYYCVQS